MNTLKFTLLGIMIVFQQYASAFPRNEYGFQQVRDTITVTGTVVDDADSQPIPGVSIVDAQRKSLALTGLRGEFNVNIPRGSAISFNMIGYSVSSLSPDQDQDNLIIRLRSSLNEMDEVVVVGYGAQKKVNVTGSVSQVSGKDLADRVVLSTSSALQGVLPGVTVAQNSGRPGTEAQIRIRGIGTLGNNNPLIILDGVVASFNDIDPENIESVSVLKDAASASIYGSRAAGGVILITSKRGTSGKMRVDYNGYAGFQTPVDLPEHLGAEQYMTLYNEALVNEGAAPIYTDDFIKNYKQNSLLDPDMYPDVNWQTTTIKSRPLQMQHNFTLNGGSDKIRMLSAFTLMDQDGLINNSGYNKASLRLNTDYRPSDKLTFKFDMNLRQETSTDPTMGSESVFNQINRVPPIYNARFSDGSWGPGWVGSNPLAWSQAGGVDKSVHKGAFINLGLRYSPVKNLSFEVIYSPSFTNVLRTNEQNAINYYDFNSQSLLFSNPQLNSLLNSNANTVTNYYRAQTDYSFNIKNLRIGLLAGAEQTDFHADAFSAQRVNNIFPAIDQINAYPELNQVTTGTAAEWAIRSLYGRATLNYLDKYLLEFNSRYDGTSRFSTAYRRFGYFPSVSAGWVISNENFLKNVNFLSSLKLRASYGSLGNQEIGNYPYISTIALGSVVFNGNIVPTGSQRELANREITWESTRVTNFGIDAYFLKNKLGFEFDYYVKKSSDILLRLPVPLTLGMEAPYQNAGKVENKGWDLSLRYRDQIGAFTFGFNGNLSDVLNKVTDLKGSGPYIDNLQIIDEGMEMNSLYGYESLGLFQSAAEVTGYATQFGILSPGDIKYKDQNNDGVVDASDRVVIGSRIPRYTYGLNLNGGFKNVTLDLSFQGVGKWNGYLSNTASWAFDNGGKAVERHMDRWTPENTDAAYPRLFISRTNNKQVSDYWMTDASYFKLKNIVIGYSFSQKLLQNSPFGNARIYLSGQNVFSIDEMYGFDPETALGGSLSYPQVSVYVVGVKLGLK